MESKCYRCGEWDGERCACKDGCTLFHGDCREVLPEIQPYVAIALVTDPPFGINYSSGSGSDTWGDGGIEGDTDTAMRDFAIQWADGAPQAVFGSWRAPRPSRTRMLLVWDTKGALGMGDLQLPWKPSHQEIYILGRDGFYGVRTSDVLCHAPVQSMARNGRLHPMQKPLSLMLDLISKIERLRTIVDPFCGSGTTLVAAKQLGRRCIGIEIEQKYCDITCSRLRQEVLQFTD